MTAFSPALAGFGTGASLIVAIGAQNAFVLRTGLARRWVLPVVLVCLVSDAVLIVVGVAGVGAVTARAPWALEVVRWLGVAFLVGYGVLALRRAARPSALAADGPAERSPRRAVLSAVGLTWLNPHVYLDTTVLIGSLAVAHGDPGRWTFGAGAVLASAVWFPLIGFGAARLGRFLTRPAAWRVVDAVIAVQLLVLAVALARPTVL
ncbi:MAG TPA: LysE/ArgO family amino acid transporter [Intrasporangium sp.]|uniref:LysE/ArgO family amino acid transporter n=1 Tax=Intrasporangium sp. TaxID=1925024 RepID=UPI002B46D55A|nr:LysE/ArgO family amino acid transporter [Intrasporangium sp.]HKX68133.1 LysE/ArgO family amino acid transporter [Intrasporangium sp.]